LIVWPTGEQTWRPTDLTQLDWLEEILDTVEEFDAASLGLVAWELSLPEEELAPAWAHAIRTGLLRPVGAGMHAPAVAAGETTYRLAIQRRKAAASPDPDGSR
jgi:hypothetical protein